MEATIPSNQLIENRTPTHSGKIYTEETVWTGTFLGGLLVTAYMMASNYKVFGNKRNAIWVWILGIPIIIIVYGSIFLFSQNVHSNIYNYIFVLLISLIGYYLTKYYQGKNIITHLSIGGKKYSMIRALLISLISCIITIAPFFIALFFFSNISYALDKSYDSKQTYNSGENIIYYQKDNVSIDKIDSIAKELQRDNWFIPERKAVVSVEIIDNVYYDVALYYDPEIEENKEGFPDFKAIRQNIQSCFPQQKIELLVLDESSNRLIKTYREGD